MKTETAVVPLCVRAAGVAVALAVLAGSSSAQAAVFTGTVTSGGVPLGGASVGITELAVGAVTSTDGRYVFSLDVSTLRGRSVELMARAIGYKPRRLLVVLAAGSAARNFELDRDVLNLDQIVVTGLSGATSQKYTAFAVAAVDAGQIRDTPGTSPLDVLGGRVAGLSLVTRSGQPGSAPAIRLRAPTSLTGTTDPLIIIDGTITRLSLADIASQDIERVEVIKGAAASSLYGSDAANGVVQIFTRRGAALAEGERNVTVRTEIGRSDLPRKVPGNMSHPYALNADGSFVLDAGGNRVMKADQISDNPYPEVFDQLAQVFKPGLYMTNYLSLGQRKGATNFNASGENFHDTGVLNVLSGFSRQNFRINVDHAVSDRIDLSTSAFYGRSTSDQGDDLGIFYSIRTLEPNINLLAKNADGTPYNALIKQRPQPTGTANPLYQLSQYDVVQARGRFTGSAKLRYRPLPWLTAEGNFNYDVANQDYKGLIPLGMLSASGIALAGRLNRKVSSDRSYNEGVTLTAVRDWRGIHNTTKAAYVYEEQANEYVAVTANALTVSHVPEFSAASPAPGSIQPDSRSELRRAKNAFIVSTFVVDNRYILDAMVRRDESSLFGSRERAQSYHRLSAAYRLSEAVHLPGVNELKLRASVGTAGLRPGYDAQYETLDIRGGNLQKVHLGNPHLKPAYSREAEFGFNLNVLTNYTVEYNYSNKLTKDQILDVPLSLASGYGSQWQNAGTLAGSTHELAIGALLLATKDYSWKLDITGDRTRSRITALKVPPFVDAFGLFRIAAGERYGEIYGEKWIRTAGQLATTIAAGKLTGTAADYVRNEEGFYVLGATKGTVHELPLTAYLADGSSKQQIGDVNPEFNLAFTNTLRWRSLSVNGLVIWVHGGNIYNASRGRPLSDGLDRVVDQRGKPLAARKPVTYYAAFFTNSDYFVEDASYIRLRELSANVELPRAWTQRMSLGATQRARLGLVGRNLWTATRYSGYDPGGAGSGDRPFSFRLDYYGYPASRTFTLMLELGY